MSCTVRNDKMLIPCDQIEHKYTQGPIPPLGHEPEHQDASKHPQHCELGSKCTNSINYGLIYCFIDWLRLGSRHNVLLRQLYFTHTTSN